MTLMALPTLAPPSAVLERSSFAGAAVQGLPALKTTIKSGSLRIEAKTRKVIPKEPLGTLIGGHLSVLCDGFLLFDEYDRLLAYSVGVLIDRFSRRSFW